MAGASVTTRFGASVRNLRFRLGISQEELASRADLHRTYISGVEAGTRNITLRSIEKLAVALQVSIPELLGSSTDAPGKFSGSDLEILLVEDNPDDVALTLSAFREAQFSNKVHVARDGEEALEFVWATGRHRDRAEIPPPRLILLDLNLPGISGLEVLRRIKDDPKTREITVVVLTASQNSRHIAASRRLGAATYIVKPVEFENFSRITSDLSMHWALLEPSRHESTVR